MRPAVRPPALVAEDLATLRAERARMLAELDERGTSADRRRVFDDDARMLRTKLGTIDAGIVALEREGALWDLRLGLLAHPRVRGVTWIQEWSGADARLVRPVGLVLRLELLDGEHRVGVPGNVDPDALAVALYRLLEAA